jgi:hypothetical protein
VLDPSCFFDSPQRHLACIKVARQLCGQVGWFVDLRFEVFVTPKTLQSSNLAITK